MRFNALHCASMRFIALLTLLLCFNATLSSQDCGTVFDLKKLKRDNPVQYQEFLRIEKLTEAYRIKMAGNPNARLIDENGTITIPVVFHVLHNGGAIGTGNNTSDARLFDQIAVLNECFSQTNNQSAIPQVFRSVAGNPNFRFILACRDPDGNLTNGIIRKQTTVTAFDIDTDNIKSTSTGGDDPWPIARYLNVWIAPSFFGQPLIFGYVPFLSSLASSPNKDGVVVRADVIGRNAGNVAGRTQGTTLVHEVGHWLNLIHLFDGSCSGDDFCADTPLQSVRTPETVTCPLAFPRNANVCSNTPSGDMYDNFMDGTNENCGRRMFTNDQVIRMRAVFQTGGPRSSFIDNYFSITNYYNGCTSKYFRVNTPFCEANNNISWSVSGPATLGFTNQNIANFNNSFTANGVATVTASWGNFTASQPLQVGYGNEMSFCTYNCGGYYPYTSTEPMRNGNAILTCYNTDINAQLMYSGAIFPGPSAALLNSSAPVYFSSNVNTFTLNFTQNFTDATIRVTIPTACGNRTVDYLFLARGGENPYYRISPNPVSNNITISAAMKKNGTTERVANDYQFEVQVFNPFGQMLASKKNVAGNPDVDIDVSRFPSNQFYTVKLISGKDVQTQKFFKQ